MLRLMLRGSRRLLRPVERKFLLGMIHVLERIVTGIPIKDGRTCESTCEGGGKVYITVDDGQTIVGEYEE